MRSDGTDVKSKFVREIKYQSIRISLKKGASYVSNLYDETNTENSDEKKVSSKKKYAVKYVGQFKRRSGYRKYIKRSNSYKNRIKRRLKKISAHKSKEVLRIKKLLIKQFVVKVFFKSVMVLKAGISAVLWKIYIILGCVIICLALIIAFLIFCYLLIEWIENILGKFKIKIIWRYLYETKYFFNR